MTLIALKLAERSPDGTITLAREVRDRMAANTDVFTDSPVTPAEQTNAITELQAAQQATLLGGKEATINRNVKLKVVQHQLRKIANYVWNVSEGNEDIITLAGLPLKSRGPRRYESLTRPQDLRAANLMSGHAALRWKKVAYARNYAVEYCMDPIVADGWQVATFNTGTRAVVAGLTRGKDYWFRVRALGTAGMVSEWSDPVVLLIN